MNEIPPDAVRVVPLGGLGEIGRNMMVYETADDLVLVDAGVLFPSEEMLGVDLIIPDMSYVAERADKLRGYLITHGHEDHIGALRYVLRDFPAPVYASRLARGLIDVKLRDAKIKDASLITVQSGQPYDFGTITAEFFDVAHSIPDAMGIALHTPAGLVVHTGDFKIDHTPVMSPPTDLQRLAAYGRDGVRLLCSDSTYADVAGFTPSEQVVGDALERIMWTAPGRVIIATFASQIARFQQILDGAAAAGRTTFVTGRSMVQNTRMARELRYITPGENAMIDVRKHEQYADEDVLIVCTGAQGEPMAALARMATGDHRDVTIKPGDTVVLSSNPIPGNESAVNRTINNLFQLGANVLYVQAGAKDVHVRGHAAQEELKTVLQLTRPQSFLPIHGEYRHLEHHRRLAEAVGVDADRCHLLLDGAILELTPEDEAVVGEAPASYVYVDGITVGDVDHTMLRDRQHLANEGIVVVVVPIDHKSGRVSGDIDVVSRGFPGMDATPDLADRVVDQVHTLLDREDHPVAWDVIHNDLKQTLSTFLYRETRQRPMVLPVAVEV